MRITLPGSNFLKTNTFRFKRHIYIVLIIFLPCFVFMNLAFLELWHSHDHNCNADPPNCGNFEDSELLAVDNIKPTKNSIIFLEDHGHNFISPRVLCAVESAARTNPQRSIFFLTTSPKVYRTPVLRNVLDNNDNIHFGYIDTNTLFSDTPLNKWFNNQRWKESYWPTYHFSDTIRWLVLWQYGGVYMDTDIIFMRKLPNSSFLALESKKILGAGAIGLPAKHDILTKCLIDISANYDPRTWGSIGPDLLTKALLHVCGYNALKKQSKNCSDITILKPKSFYPIHWLNWKQYFSEIWRYDIFEDVEVLGLHVWNALSKNELIHFNQNSLYAIAANKFCPSVVKSVKNRM